MSSEIARHWRLKPQRYNLIGEQCPHCETLMFPPRDICIDCGGLAKGTVEEVYSNLKVSSPTEVSRFAK